MKIDLKYPTVDMLAERMFNLGENCYMWKKDLSQGFRQLPLDPGDYELFGYLWEGLYYWDKVLVMGHRIAPYICQRVTSALAYIH